MIYTVFAAAALSFWFLRRLRREMTTQNRTASFSFLLVENALKFLRPFIAVTLFYVALSLALRDYDSTTIAVLRTYEESLGKIKDFLKLIRLTPTVSLIVLVGAFAFTLFADALTTFRPYKVRIERLRTVLEKYQKIVGRGVLIITLLGSFTFFGGTAVSAQLDKLELAIKHLQKDCENLTQSIEKEVRIRAAAKLMQTLPSISPPLRPVFAIHERIDRRYDDLLRQRAASKAYQIDSPTSENLLHDMSERRGKFAEATNATKPVSEINGHKYEKFVSKKKLGALNKLLGTYAAESAQFAKRLLETPLGGRIGTSVINILISEGHIPGIDALTKEIPIAGPILSILTDSVRKKTSSLVAKATDRIMNDALSDYTPSLEGRIEQGAESVAKAALQGQFPDTSDVATNLSSAAQANLAKFEAAQKEFDQLLETKQQALFKANRDLVQRLRIGRAKKGLPEWSTNKPRADDIFSSFNLTARPRISSIAEIEKMKQQIKIEEAIDKLISAALKITDPLAQNHILTGIENAVSDPLVSSQVQKLTDLGALAGISSREVTAALHELKALEPHPSSMDYVHTTRIKPIRVEPIRFRLPRR